jgi:hypothetical protein
MMAALRSSCSVNPAIPLEALSLDIARLVERDLAARCGFAISAANAKPSRSGSIRRRVRRHSTKSRASIAPTAPKQTVDRYINEFERLLDEVSRDERGPAALRGHLVSETGLVYTLLAHAAGRLG